MLKAYVFRMYPNEKQIINQTIGNSRFIYNYFLDEKIKEYKELSKSKSAYEQMKYIPYLTIRYPWLKDCDSEKFIFHLCSFVIIVLTVI